MKDTNCNKEKIINANLTIKEESIKKGVQNYLNRQQKMVKFKTYYGIYVEEVNNHYVLKHTNY